MGTLLLSLARQRAPEGSLRGVEDLNHKRHHKSVFIEVDALALLAGHANIIRPLRDFTIPANRSGDLEEGEEHIVVATTLYNGTLKKILNASPSPPLPFVRRAMIHVLRGLAHMHSRGFVHTDLKADNILVDCGPLMNAAIDAMLVTDPPRRCPPKASGLLPVAASQPLPVPTVDDAMTRTFCISDMGAVCHKDYLKAGMKLSPEGLQAPEIIFGAPLDEKVDIWLFGLLMLETVTGKTLFRYVDAESDAFIPFLLWQMSAVLSDVDAFPPYLREGIHAAKYLDADGLLFELDLPPKAHSTLHFMVANRRPDLDPAERGAILAIVLRCLQLDPRARPSVAELLEDPWWGDV